MDTDQPDVKENKKLERIVTVVLVLIIVIAIIFLSTNFFLGNKSNLPNEGTITASYNFISPDAAHQFIVSTTHNLTIIDVRSCKCKYDGEHIPGSIWNVNPISFYNTTDDLLVYDELGVDNLVFCEDLVNHTYGKILYLQGGIEAWKSAGYRVE
jgi:rhodanese-related sulfurtransferase